jgi:uncharacterized protein (UPF0218 family)
MKLKSPLGNLIIGSSEETMPALKEILKNEKPKKLFAIGDVITHNLMKYGIEANLSIIDNKTMRKNIETTQLDGKKVINSRNPPGMITAEAWDAVKKGVEDPSITYIVVDGEEDLLTLPVIRYAPLRALVMYGQPSKGVVLVWVTESKKKEVEALIDEMEQV